jgi:hypothetical protein
MSWSIDTPEIAVLRDRRLTLVAARKKAEAELAGVNHQIRGNRLPTEQYRRLLNRQHRLGQDMREFDTQLAENKHSLQRLVTENEAAHQERLLDVAASATGTSSLAESVVSLLAKYRALSQDRTRISSIRVVAAEVADDIEAILKRNVK